jgi:hypothetical protein
MPRGPDRKPRKRKTLSPADFGSRKKRPIWATEQTLRRVICGPSVRYYRIVRMYYWERRTLREISRETGIKQDQLAIMLMKVRRAMGAKIERIEDSHINEPEWDKRTEWVGQTMVTRSPGNRGTGRYAHVPLMFNDALLRKCILSRALETYGWAVEFWLQNDTLENIAARHDSTKSTVGLRLWQIKRRMEHPPARRYRERVYLTRIQSSWGY